MAARRRLTSVDCPWRVSGLCLYGMKLALGELNGHLTTNGNGTPLTLDTLLASLAEAGLDAKDLRCPVTNGSPCPYAATVPHYKKRLGELWVGNILVRHFQRHGNQTLILEAFEEQGWPDRIEDPLGCDACIAENKLRDSVYELNCGQKTRLIDFSCDGTGSGVCWKFASGFNPFSMAAISERR